MSFNKKFLSKSPLTSHGSPHSGEEKWKQQKANYDKYQNQLDYLRSGFLGWLSF